MLTYTKKNVKLNFKLSSDDQILSSLIKKAWFACFFQNHFKGTTEQLLCALFL